MHAMLKINQQCTRVRMTEPYIGTSVDWDVPLDLLRVVRVHVATGDAARQHSGNYHTSVRSPQCMYMPTSLFLTVTM
jgi:hypothetical protein